MKALEELGDMRKKIVREKHAGRRKRRRLRKKCRRVYMKMMPLGRVYRRRCLRRRSMKKMHVWRDYRWRRVSG